MAFPSISTGIFEAPLNESAQNAVSTVQTFIKAYPDAYEEVRFVFLPSEPHVAAAYETALKNLK